MWWDSSFVEDARYLDLLWLDRFIVAQGDRFREWPRWTWKESMMQTSSLRQKKSPLRKTGAIGGEGFLHVGGHSWDEKRRARYGQTLRN